MHIFAIVILVWLVLCFLYHLGLLCSSETDGLSGTNVTALPNVLLKQHVKLLRVTIWKVLFNDIPFIVFFVLYLFILR